MPSQSLALSRMLSSKHDIISQFTPNTQCDIVSQNKEYNYDKNTSNI